MKKSIRKTLSLVLVLAFIIGMIPAFTITAAADDEIPALWTQAAATTLAQGNIARTGTTVGQYENGANAATRATNGTLPTAAGSNHWNTWGAAATIGSQASPVWIYQSWTQPYTVEGTRVMWHIFTDAGVRWPNAANVQYLRAGGDPAVNGDWINIFPYTPLANSADRVGVADPNSPIGVDGKSGTNATNRIWPAPSTWARNDVWNIVKFPAPVTTQGIRMQVYGAKNGGTSPGIGVGAWEIFGYSDPLLADVDWAITQIGSLTNLVADKVLPASRNTTTFTYESSNPAVFGDDGQVTRPAIGEPDATGTLKVTATDGTRIEERTLNWSVRALISAAQALALDLAWLTVTGADPATANINLPTVGPEGSVITWESDIDYIWSDGTVLRPPQGSANASGTLTATLTFDDASDEKVFPVSVLAWPTGGKRIVSHEPLPINSPQGTAPKLPPEVLVTYSDGSSDMRRVMWGRNSAANQTADAGRPVGEQYNVTGNVMGDGNGAGFVVTANVTVVNRAANLDLNTPSNVPVAKALPLGAVQITNDDNGSTQNILTRNRTGWVSYIVGQTTSRYIQPFRTAYGLSTTGYTAPSGWTGKLRGFGSGHYMSGLAMAYATPGITSSQRTTLIGAMERMTRELRFVQEMTMDVPHPTEDRLWQGRDFLSGINLDGTAHAQTGNQRVMAMNGNLSNWLEYASSTNPNEGPKSYGHGYLNAIPPHHLVGNERYLGYNDGGSGVWAPYYGLHKILAGLMEIYYVLDGSTVSHEMTLTGAGIVGGNTQTITEQEIADKAFAIAYDMSLWISDRLGHRTQPGYRPASGTGNSTPGYRDTIWGTYIAGEHGGIAESIARVLDITGDERLHDGVEAFWNDGNGSSYGNIPHFEALANNRDALRTLHANTHIPQMTGSAWAFRTGVAGKFDNNNDYWRMADSFVDYNRTRYAWATGNVKGGTSNIETYTGAYNQVSHLHTHTGANETCAAYNLMKLNKYLSEHNPTDAKYMDHWEKLFTCQMVGSTRVGNSSGSNTYHYNIHLNTSKSRGGSSTTDASCCAGTAIENHVKYQDALYFESLTDGIADGKTLYVAQYMPSIGTWAAQNATITQSCVWPSQHSTFSVAPGADTGAFEMQFRVPAWATKDFDIKLNGVSLQAEYTPSSYVSTGIRTWLASDRVEVIMPFDFWIDFLPQRHTNGMWVGAMMYGPVLMAGRSISSWATVEVDSFLSTGAGTNITLNGTSSIAAAAAGDNAPSVALNNVPTMTVRTNTTNMSGGTNRTFYPHYVVEGSYTTYFYIRYVDESVADRTELYAKMVEAKSFLGGNFTAETLGALQAAINTASGVYQNIGSTEAQLAAQVVALDAAINALENEGPTDFAELVEAVAAAKLPDEALYTTDSWDVLQAEIVKAEAMIELGTATQVQVIQQVNALKAAVAALEPIAGLDKYLLSVALETAEAMYNPPNTGEKLWPQHDYTQFTRLSWADFLEAQADAIAVDGNVGKNFSQAEIDAAVSHLNAMMGALVAYTISDERDDLTAKINEAKALAAEAGVWSPASLAALEFAIETAEERFIYASLTFLEMYSVIDEVLQPAIDGLVALADLVTRVVVTGNGSIEPGDTAVFTVALANAENVNIARLDVEIDYPGLAAEDITITYENGFFPMGDDFEVVDGKLQARVNAVYTGTTISANMLNLFKISFVVPDEGVATVSVDAHQVVVVDDSPGNYDFEPGNDTATATVIVEEIVIPCVHDIEWTITIPAQIGIDGEMEGVCTICGETFTDTVPALTRPSGPGGGAAPLYPLPPVEIVVPDAPPLDEVDIDDEATPLDEIPNPYVDIFGEEWFYDYAIDAYYANLITGIADDDGLKFDPNAPLTRAMVATILYRLAGSPSAEGLENPFTDLDQDWYRDAVIWGYANGVVEGYGAGIFRPTQDITREQMAAMLFRYANYAEVDTSADDIIGFGDIDSITPYAVPAMAWAIANEIIQGTAGNLNPQDPATRAQFAAVLMRFVELVDTTEEVDVVAGEDAEAEDAALNEEEGDEEPEEGEEEVEEGEEEAEEAEE